MDEPYLVLMQDDGEEMEMVYPPLFEDLTSHTNKLLAIFRSHGVNMQTQ